MHSLLLGNQALSDPTGNLKRNFCSPSDSNELKCQALCLYESLVSSEFGMTFIGARTNHRIAFFDSSVDIASSR